MNCLQRIAALQKLANQGHALVELTAGCEGERALDAICENLDIKLGIDHKAYATARADLSRSLLKSLMTRWGKRIGFEFVDIYTGTPMRPECYLLFRTKDNAIKWCPSGCFNAERLVLMFSLYWRCS